MSDSVEPLAPELADFLRPEAQRPDPSLAMRDAVFERLSGTLGPLGGSGGSGSSGGSSSAPGGAAPGASVTGGAGRVAGVARPWASLGLRTVVTLAIGAVVGAGVEREIHRRAEHVAAAPASPSPKAEIAAAPRPVIEAPQPAERSAPPAAASVAGPSGKLSRNAPDERRARDRDLGAERALIEQARTALSRGQAASALAALEQHRRQHPHGELQEERESLLVQALVTLDQPEQARQVGVRFHRLYPRSIFGAVVDEALRSIP